MPESEKPSLLGRLRNFDATTINYAMWVIVVPMILVVIYYTLIAADRYVCESKIIVLKSTDAVAGSAASGISLPSILGSGGASQEDELHLVEYISSADMLDQLDKEIGYRKEFGLHGLDVLYWLPNWSWVSREYGLEFYRARIDLKFDDKNGILTLATQGFTREFAQQVNQIILRESERFMNELSHRVAREQLAFANDEVHRARQELDKAKGSLLGYQNRFGLLDPAGAADTTNRIAAELEGQLSSKEADLKAATAFMADNSPQVLNLRNTIAAIRHQMDVEKAKLTSQEGLRMNRIAAEYLDVKAMVDFESDLYKVSLGTYEKSRIDALRQIKSVAVIANPVLPDRAEYPRRIYMIIACFFVLLLGYGFVRLVVAVIEDHRD
jgi:capsular polysaccharide transport system permease protein